MTRILTLSSGKGGVGKTSISLNLALCLAESGNRVGLFDADLGLANVNILTGIHPEHDILSVLEGYKTLQEIIIPNFQGVDIIPGSSGVEKLANLTHREARTLIRSFLDLEDYDFFIFDTSAGISSQVLAFCMASKEILLVITPEPTSLTDAYALVKVLSKRGYSHDVSVIINQVKKASQAQKAFSKLSHTVKRFLNVRLKPLGVIAADSTVRRAVIDQIPFYLLYPDSKASRSIQALSRRLIQTKPHQPDLPLEIYWDQCLSFLQRADTDLAAASSEKPPAASSVAENIPPAPSPSKHDPAGRPGESARLHARLDAIEKGMAELLREFKAIKEHLKGSGETQTESASPPPPGKPAEIRLDFETWLACHHNHGIL